MFPKDKSTECREIFEDSKMPLTIVITNKGVNGLRQHNARELPDRAAEKKTFLVTFKLLASSRIEMLRGLLEKTPRMSPPQTDGQRAGDTRSPQLVACASRIHSRVSKGATGGEPTTSLEESAKAEIVSGKIEGVQVRGITAEN